MSKERPRRLPLILDSLETIGRSWWTVIGGLGLGVALFFVSSAYVPRSYQAESRILVDLDRIPVETGDAEATPAAIAETEIRHALTHRGAIIDALAQVGVGGSEDAGDEERLVNQAMDNISIKGPYDDGTFAVTYKGATPETASEFVNALTEGFVDARSNSRPGVDTGFVVEIEAGLSELRQRIDPLRTQVAEFKKQYAHETEASRSANREMLASRRADLESNRAAVKSARSRLADLTTQGPRLESLAEDCVTQSTPGGGRLVDRERELQRLQSERPRKTAELERSKDELESLLLGYVPTRDELLAHRKCGIEAAKLVDVVAPTLEEIDTVKAEIARLESEHVTIREAIQTYESRIELTPLREGELAQLTAEYEMLMDEYRGQESRLFEARRGLETDQAGLAGLYEVVARSSHQDLLLRPGIPLIASLSIAIGLLLFVAPVTVRGFLFPAVTSEAGLKAISPVPILVSIPELPAHEVVEADRRRLLKNMAFSMMMVAISAMVIALMYYRG